MAGQGLITEVRFLDVWTSISPESDPTQEDFFLVSQTGIASEG
jgi:hypothetical protein